MTRPPTTNCAARPLRRAQIASAEITNNRSRALNCAGSSTFTCRPSGILQSDAATARRLGDETWTVAGQGQRSHRLKGIPGN
ncbi:hypothetical protein J6590_052325 [Homalodisca vitripennis]|nr:hypothetical protein J6590_052325 [Homalodisca vitripennis]